jgi:transposase
LLTHFELGKGSWAMRKQSLELRHMRAIVMLAEELSYTKVARRLGVLGESFSKEPEPM